MSQKDAGPFPFLSWNQTYVWQQSLQGILRLVLFDELTYALLIKALFCGEKHDLHLTICQLLNYGIFTALQRFSVMICRLYFVTAATVNSDTIHFH
jgi:hypothetical protein